MDSLRENIIDIIKFISDTPIYAYWFICSIIQVTKQALAPAKSFEGEKVLITGAASGIGQEIALQLSSTTNDITLVLWDINKNGLVKTTEQCRTLGAKVLPYVVDLSKREDIARISQKVRNECGTITTLINNAGVVVVVPFLDADPDMEEKVIKINFMSHLWVTREFLPDMILSGKGHLVSMLSGLALYKWKNYSSYIASKYALRGFLETLKVEMLEHPKKPDIKITAVYPGWVKTPMTSDAIVWEPRYNFKVNTGMDSQYAAEKIIEGIRSEKEEVIIPESIKLFELLSRILPTPYVNRVHDYVYRDRDCQPRTQMPKVGDQIPSPNGQNKPSSF